MKHRPGCRVLEATLLSAILALVLACSEGSAPSSSGQPSRPPPREVPEAEPEVEEEPETEEEEKPPEYVYSPIGKRDPFRSPFLDLVAMEDGSEGSDEQRTPLQRWDIEQLTLQAVISATADPMAMVIDPEGHGHVVRRGVLVGRNWGRVTAIRRECIVVTEQMRDATGTPMAVQQERCLPKDERESRFEEQMRQQVQ